MTNFAATFAAALALAMPTTAFAGMGKVFPTYHPAPCSGDDCRADDPRSNKDCTGLLCTFSSAKAMSPPVTASQAAEAERARATAAPPEPAPTAAAPTKKAKRVARTTASTKVKSPAKIVTDTPAPTSDAAAR